MGVGRGDVGEGWGKESRGKEDESLPRAFISFLVMVSRRQTRCTNDVNSVTSSRCGLSHESDSGRSDALNRIKRDESKGSSFQIRDS